MNKVLTKKKSKRTTSSSTIAVFILIVSFLPFLHDWDYFSGKSGFSGYSSLRIAVWVTSLFTIALSGWIVAFINSKGKPYRFVLLVPIAMLCFQLCIYVLDARKATINEFSNKIIINGVLIFALVAYYFVKRRKAS